MALQKTMTVGQSQLVYDYHRIHRVERLALARDGGTGAVGIESYQSKEARGAGDGAIGQTAAVGIQLTADEAKQIAAVLYAAVQRQHAWMDAVSVDPEPETIGSEPEPTTDTTAEPTTDTTTTEEPAT